MGDQMRIDMRQLGGAQVLSGALNGRSAFGKLMAQTPETAEPTTVFLDFGKVDVATASYLRESVLSFRDAVRQRRSNLYPVVANAKDAIRDELLELAKARNDVVMVCTLDAKDKVRHIELLGELDPKQKLTLDLITKQTETDAAELMRIHGNSEGVQQTAWNNRLAALAMRGLVMEFSVGRAKKYRPLFARS